MLGAQQAFTDTFNSVIGNAISVAVTLIAMFVLSWQITVLSLLIHAVFIFSRPGGWRRPYNRRLPAEAYSLHAPR